MKKTTTLIAFCTIATTVFAQISITNSNMPNSSDTLRYSTAQMSSVGDFLTSGANHNWDFSNLNPNGQGIRSFKPSLATPYGFFFLPPKFGEKQIDTVKLPSIITNSLTVTDIFAFYKKSSTQFITEGLGVKLNGFPVPNFNSDDDELYLFPLNYLDRDSTTFAFSTVTTTLVPFTYKKKGYRITEADGWGSVTTPYGTANCLRVVTTQYSRDSIYTTLLPSPFNKFGFPNYQRSYQWLTLGERIPYLEVIGNVALGNFTPTQIRYRDNMRSFVGIEENSNPIALSVFPNPTNNQLIILLPKTEESVLIEMVDLQGKVVMKETTATNQEMINQHTLMIDQLAKGLYILNLSTKTNKQTLKISVQ